MFYIIKFIYDRKNIKIALTALPQPQCLSYTRLPFKLLFGEGGKGGEEG